MRKPKLHELIAIYFKRACAFVGWKLFLFGSETTEERYWTDIYYQEKQRLDYPDGCYEKNGLTP